MATYANGAAWGATKAMETLENLLYPQAGLLRSLATAGKYDSTEDAIGVFQCFHQLPQWSQVKDGKPLHPGRLWSISCGYQYPGNQLPIDGLYQRLPPPQPLKEAQG